MEEEIYFEIKDGNSHLKLIPVKTDSHGFIKTIVDVKGGVFSGAFEADFSVRDFEFLNDKFSYLYDNLNSNFEFESLEADLGINAKGTGTGHFTVLILAYDTKKFPNENVLKFELFVDQSHITNYIYQLEKILKEYS